MKPTLWFNRTNPVLSSLRIVLAFALVIAAGTMAFLAAKTAGSLSASNTPAIGYGKKGEPDRMKVGRNAQASIGANESRSVDYTPSIEAYLQRAYPASEVPMKATMRAQKGFTALVQSQQASFGVWQLIGPSKAVYPGVLNQLGDGAPYIASGRTNALAIAPTCTTTNCRVYVGAAGGGIWRTLTGLSDTPSWEFVSGSFASNAIGSILIDPNVASGNTIYVGTGEENASGDSEAGLGIYKSTDGGTTWALLPGSAQFAGRSVADIAVTPNGVILAGIARAVRGISSVTGGSTSNPPVAAGFGVYRSTDGGATFVDASGPLGGTIRGINQIRVDPSSCFGIPGANDCGIDTWYASSFGAGIWRTHNGTAASPTWTQIKTPQGASNAERSEFGLAYISATNITRMYVGNGSQAGPAHFYSTQNSDVFFATNATFIDQTNGQSINYCTGQCFYDNQVYSPPGHPNYVYLLGSFDYNQIQFVSNGRAVLLSTDGGFAWSDLTQDGKPRPARHEFTHPDQHAIIVNPNNPFQYWEGNDGGVIRSDGTFVDGTSQCTERGLTGANLTYCQGLLSRVPHLLTSLNTGLSTLQFQSLSAANFQVKGGRHGSSTLELQGGTQDNGTFQYLGLSDTWPQIIYGDGGNSGFAASSETMRVNSFFGQFQDVNFRSGDPSFWVIATGKIASSPEGSFFYPPVTADPVAPATIYEGSQSVWRTQDWAGNQAFLEANCPEFTTSGANPACGDFVRMGAAGLTDLTSPAYGADRVGSCASAGTGCVAVVERRTSDAGTLWAATGTGRVFISFNANAAAASVVWNRIDQTSAASPGRFPSSIFPDVNNPNHAWISYSGYSALTPATPGHVFSVTWNGAVATFTNITFNLPDFPITDLVHDDTNGDLYAASDFGVMRLASGAGAWTLAGTGLPMVEVAGLTLVQGEHKLFAATHGRSAWQLTLPGADN